MRPLILIFCVVLLSSSKKTIDYEYLKSRDWSYSGGYRITDFINFKETSGYSVRGDTLLLDNRPRAIILRLDKASYDLTIQSLDGLKEGHYMSDEEMLK